MRSFFLGVLHSFVALVIACCLAPVFFLVAMVAFAVLFSSIRSTLPDIPEQAVLVWDLALDINDASPDGDAWEDTVMQHLSQSTGSVALLDFLETLQQAALDSRIKGLFIHGSLSTLGSSPGFGLLQEVRQGLQHFRSSGKPIIAFLERPTMRDYFLASVADEVLLNPFGLLSFQGFSIQGMYLGDALKKYGIGVQVTQAGRYKSAVEMYTENEMSDTDREQLSSLLANLWEEYLGAISESRGIEPQQLLSLSNEMGAFTPEQAVEAQLADGLAYFDQILTRLITIAGSEEGSETFKQVDMVDYVREFQLKRSQAKISPNKVAIVYAKGEMVLEGDRPDEMDAHRLARELRKIRQDDTVQAVVLRIDSPGGDAQAAAIIERELLLLRDDKPLIISMGSAAASGGYWIAAAGDYLFCDAGSVTGSIGVFGLHFDIAQISNNHGITWDDVSTGPFADMYSFVRPKTAAEMALFQYTTDWLYDAFTSRVAEARDMTLTRVQEVANGRVWSGNQAVTVGLVDELGGLQAAVAKAVEQADLQEDWSYFHVLPERSFWARLKGRLLDSDDEHLALWRAWVWGYSGMARLPKCLRFWQNPQGVYAQMPYRIDFVH